MRVVSFRIRPLCKPHPPTEKSPVAYSEDENTRPYRGSNHGPLVAQPRTQSLAYRLSEQKETHIKQLYIKQHRYSSKYSSLLFVVVAAAVVVAVVVNLPSCIPRTFRNISDLKGCHV